MILRKYMSLLGIGSAQINLIMQKKMYKLGDSVHGYFSIKGGSIEQQIKRIDCDLVVNDQTAHIEKVIDSTTILTSIRIQPEELYEVPFTFQLPVSGPVSTEEVSYHFKTGLTFDKGVGSRNQDIIQIIQ
ncbi:sporulation protein [Sporosarcina sp. ACRSM]|uniref:sporulation protein n=1 Tax=Sporosarcina sp. ACRSM TaxID=2918216 RepID=UPI001EF63013|nr:sporulation protein [Sporosarcina sp. ACRSM]MCG7336112.1 sporulation protein [Sporosarcina sp. ACRSM]